MMVEFLSGVPGDKVLEALSRAPGNEVKHGKFDSPDSSSALVANAFGWFLDRPEGLPAFPGLGGRPAYALTLAAEMRFPWAGGRHPWLDVGIETDSLLIGVESKRYEPYRPLKNDDFSEAYERDVWGNRMGRYSALMKAMALGEQVFRSLDAVQLVKHAFGLRTQGIKKARQPVLVYLYAEPKIWAGSGKPLDAAKIAQHRAEIDRFGTLVEGDHVTFLPLSWAQLLETWTRKPALRPHVAALRARFGDLGE